MSARLQTLDHIRKVRELLQAMRAKIVDREAGHDASKLMPPEEEVFEVYTEKLKGITYGSDEYKQCLAEMKPALDHHYANNRHHPEHWPNGVSDMSLIDLCEMLSDWYAASQRHDDGSIMKSIDINTNRFNLTSVSPDIQKYSSRDGLERIGVCDN